MELDDCMLRSDSSGREEVILGIDKFTGLPKLAIELPPEDVEREDRVKLAMSGTSKGYRAKSEDRDTRKSPKVSSAIPRELVQHTSDRTNGGGSSSLRRRGMKQPQHLGMAKRSKSVFIRLQVPQKTPPTPHRSLAILEKAAGPERGIQTAPITEENHFNFQNSSDDVQRRSSDSSAYRRGGGGERSSSEQILDEEEGMDEVSHNLPRFTSGTVTGRRPSSILYLSDTDDEQPAGTSTSKPISRTSSMGSSHVGDETYITPFAQILANLHRVRSQFLTLMGLPDDVRTNFSHSRSAGTLPSQSFQSSSRNLTGEASKLAWDTLEELDWCLKKLESEDSTKSMGIMAQDKFRRILFRELSHLSENSKSGTQVAEWVQGITNFDFIDENAMDKALDNFPNVISHQRSLGMEPSLSTSLAHDEWSKMHRPSSSSAKMRVHNYCERVPVYGVICPDMDMEKMREFMNKQPEIWGADTFYLSKISGGNPLVTAAYTIFKRRKLLTTYKICPPVFVNFMMSIQDHYHPNPYHNSAHAADVFLATHLLLKAKALEEVFTDLEILAVLVAAAIHDVDHPGRSNPFLVNTGHELALLYNDNSVLENHHLAVAFKIMQSPKCNFLENLDATQRGAFRRMVIDMVLATDMTRHLKHLGELKTLLETKKVANEGILVLDKYKDRLELLKCLIHCADLSNPTKPEHLAAEWARRVMQEAFLQGDEEKKLGIPVNPIGDRDQVCFEKCQVTFIDFIVYPLWETWAELVYPDAQDILENINKTRDFWNSQLPNSPPPSSSSEDSEDTPTDSINLHDTRSRSAEPRTEEPRTDSLTIASSPTSFTDSKRSSFSNSPASERRTSFKTLKQQGIRPSEDENR